VIKVTVQAERDKRRVGCVAATYALADGSAIVCCRFWTVTPNSFV